MMRRPKNSKSLGRKKPKKSPFPKILIICEGTKSEPNYFKDIKRTHKLSSADIRIAKNECGTAPKSIVECAKQLSKEEKADEVYCIFDRDDHDTFHDAKQHIKDLNKSPKWPRFKAIISNPCFEFWVLLHFEFSAKQYVSMGGRSKGDQVNHDLKGHIQDYGKGTPGLYGQLRPRYTKAVAHAKKLEEHLKNTGAQSPYTNMYEIVDRLKKYPKSL